MEPIVKEVTVRSKTLLTKALFCFKIFAFLYNYAAAVYLKYIYYKLKAQIIENFKNIECKGGPPELFVLLILLNI